ncbi:MAG: 2Fe-2S iron-sulfur cluster binding domain-containing protein [Gammaproteobacteria bacterium]|nr:2Fe-2S iron-sulfur cluster binding domain-containing protein [Gammaproteobacteria bacterium]
MQELRLAVNGTPQTLAVESRTLLVDVLRRNLNLTGTHIGCDDGRCGACTVRVNGAPVKSCLVLAHQVDGAKIDTVEGLAPRGTLGILQTAFKRHHGLQCGFCTPGMLMSAAALLERNSTPSEVEVRAAIAGNLCRCTGYQHIVESVLSAAAELRGEARPAMLTHAQSDSGKSVGQNVERVQDARLLTGRGRFSADVLPPGTLHAAILRSPHAHARIKRVDATRARAIPGVIEVLTGAEAQQICKPLPPTINIAMRMNTSYSIAVDRVRYHGEPVAALAAIDPYLAEDALAAIEVEYELLPPVVDMAGALASNAPRLYDEWPDNRCLESDRSPRKFDR